MALQELTDAELDAVSAGRGHVRNAVTISRSAIIQKNSSKIVQFGSDTTVNGDGNTVVGGNTASVAQNNSIVISAG